MATVLNPFTYIADPVRGRPVFNGRVYFGRPDTDPVQPENRINVRAINEDGTFTTIAQPVRTGPGGIALNNGNPAQLDLIETEYSITIQDNQGVQRYYSPRVNIFGDLGDTIGNIEQFRTFGTPRFITAADNAGSPFPYDQYARVVYNDGTDDRIYESLVDGNTSLPNDTTNWRLADLQGLETEFSDLFLTESNNLSDLENLVTARLNLGLGSAATRATGTNNNQIPLIGNPATTGLSAVVTNSGSNTNGNYRTYSDGLIIQWGQYSGAANRTVTMPTRMTTTNYFVSIQLDRPNQQVAEANEGIRSRTTTNFFVQPGLSDLIAVLWFVLGF